MSGYKLATVRIHGAICGHTWMPQRMCSTGYRTVDVERRLARYSDPSGATMRDVVLSELCENGGDFQDALFSCDTVIAVTRVRKLPSGAWVTHTRDVPLARWADCADLVHADVYGFDFG